MIIFIKIALFFLSILFTSKMSIAQCSWDVTNCIDCELEINLCWDDGVNPIICTTFVIAPGCQNSCSYSAISLPSQFCSGTGTIYGELQRTGSYNCNGVRFVNGDVICCNGNFCANSTPPNCVIPCECARVGIFPASSPPLLEFSDLLSHGIPPCN